MALYWYGGSGNWSDYANHWSNNSGNSPASPASAAPTSTDDVIFDSASASGNYTVTIDATASCKDFTASAPSSGNLTLSFSGKTLNCYGSLTWYSGMVATTSTSSYIYFYATSTGKTVSFAGTTTSARIDFNGSGGGWTLQTDVICYTLQFTKSTLDTNDVAITCSRFSSTGGTLRTLSLGNSVITCSESSAIEAFRLDATNLTFNAEGSTIKLTGNENTFSGGSKTFYNVEQKMNSSVKDGWCLHNGSNTYNNLTFYSDTQPMAGVVVYGNLTVNGTFTCTGTQAAKVVVLGDTAGRTITAAAVSITDTNFWRITGAGAASPFTGTRVGNGGACSGITFEAAVDRYWINANGGNYNDINNWSTGDGGSGGATVPLPQDTAYFTAASFAANGKTVTLNVGIIGNIDATGVDVTLTMSPNSAASDFYHVGHYKLASGAKINGNGNYCMYHTTFNGETIDLNYGGGTWPGWWAITTESGGTTRLTGPAVMTNGTAGAISISGAGTFDFNDQDFTFYGLLINSGLTVYFGNGTLEWNSNTEFKVNCTTLYCESSTIKFSYTGSSAATFTGLSKTYNKFWRTGTGTSTLTISGVNTFAEFVDDGSAAHTIKFTNSHTQTITTFTVNGSRGKLITLTNTSSTTQGILALTGIQNCTYLSISNISVSTGTLNAWESTNGGNTTANVFDGKLFSTSL